MVDNAQGWQGVESGRCDTSSMASANLDLVRSIYADWQRGDFSSVEWAHPEIEYVHADMGMFVRESSKGLVGLAEAARARIEVVKNVRTQAEEYRELDDQRVLVLDRTSGTMKHSGIAFGGSTSMPSIGAHLFDVRDGKVTKLVAYANRDRALGDLGLATESGAAPPE
jgi:ketosteroid isomerase-like protein